MNSKATDLDNIISSLAVFSALKEDPAIDDLRSFLEADDGETSEQLDYLSDFAAELYRNGGDLPAYIRRIVMLILFQLRDTTVKLYHDRLSC